MSVNSNNVSKLDFTDLDSLVRRMKKLGIKLEMGGNFPWIYLEKINSKKVTEKFQGNHGFTVAWMPIKFDDPKVKLSNITEIFKLIRKYCKE